MTLRLKLLHATKREYALTPLETIRDTGPALSFSLCVFDLVRGGQHYGNGWRVIREGRPVIGLRAW